MNRFNAAAVRANSRSFQPSIGESITSLARSSPMMNALVGESNDAGSPNTYKFEPPTPMESLISAAGAAGGAYHGYMRNDSVGWALWWGFCGSAAPLLTGAIAVAQGYGKRASK